MIAAAGLSYGRAQAKPQQTSDIDGGIVAFRWGIILRLFMKCPLGSKTAQLHGQTCTACVPATKPRPGTKQYEIEIILVHECKRRTWNSKIGTRTTG